MEPMQEKSLAGVDVVAYLRNRLASHPDKATEDAIKAMEAWIAESVARVAARRGGGAAHIAPAWGYVAIRVDPTIVESELAARLESLPRGKLGWSDDDDHLPLPEEMPCWVQGEAIGKVIVEHAPALRAHILETAKTAGTHGGIIGRWFPLMKFGSETLLVVKILDNTPANT